VIPLSFPKFCPLLADVPTRRKVFHRFQVASRQYLALLHWLLFRAKKEEPSSAETQGCGPEELRGQSQHYAASGSTLPKNIGG
jgi:hypothetical protein